MASHGDPGAAPPHSPGLGDVDRRRPAHVVRAPLRNLVDEAGAPVVLLGQLITSVLHDPRGFWGDVLDDTHRLLRKILIPSILANAGYSFLTATIVVAVTVDLGAAGRGGTIIVPPVMRMLAPLISAVVVAGVIGTATTAELGARKIREELDALRVLGQDPVRMLVLPRVIATVIITWVTGALGVLVFFIETTLLTTTLSMVSPESYMSYFLGSLTVYEVMANVVRGGLFGLIIGVVCASKGLTARFGPEGVGRAVNQAVVIAISSLFIFNLIFDLILLGLIPNFTVIR